MDVDLICWVFVQRSLDAQVFANKRQAVIFFIHLEILPPCHAQVLVTMVPLSSASEFIPNAPAATHDVTYA
jgi:hypothetical protein